jgi:hypothetical protein
MDHFLVYETGLFKASRKEEWKNDLPSLSGLYLFGWFLPWAELSESRDSFFRSPTFFLLSRRHKLIEIKDKKTNQAPVRLYQDWPWLGLIPSASYRKIDTCWLCLLIELPNSYWLRWFLDWHTSSFVSRWLPLPNDFFPFSGRSLRSKSKPRTSRWIINIRRLRLKAGLGPIPDSVKEPGLYILRLKGVPLLNS